MVVLANIPDGYYQVPDWDKPQVGDIYLDVENYSHGENWIEIKEGDEELKYSVSDFMVLARRLGD